MTGFEDGFGMVAEESGAWVGGLEAWMRFWKWNVGGEWIREILDREMVGGLVRDLLN